MRLILLASAWFLTSSLTLAHADSSNTVIERGASTKSVPKVPRRCPEYNDDEPHPICGPPRPPIDPSVHSYTVKDPANPNKPVSFKITVPETLTVATWDETLLTNLRTTVPSMLRQLSVDTNQISALTSEGIPLIVEAITAVQSGLSLPDDSSGIARRGLFSKIGRWIKKVVTFIVQSVRDQLKDIECTLFSMVTLPGYLFSDLGFLTLNAFNGQPTTADQDYFINPLHGSFSHTDDVQVYYGATFAPGFGANVAGVTFGSRIYLRTDSSAISASTPLLQDRAFQQKTKLLLHEFTHVKQYKNLGYFHPTFALAYMKSYCLAGYNYENNRFEVEAYQKQEQVNRLLTGVIGTQFMDKWKQNNWVSAFGLPTNQDYNEYPNLPGQYFLQFQNGGIQLVCNSANVC
ncbi:MAG: hypothetical protein LQ341_003366 [Variospora aurantia]|nr:MAG: hypothetical protein LQ341_003366 [Variospora aurantia]